jgi:hypothetical protein
LPKQAADFATCPFASQFANGDPRPFGVAREDLRLPLADANRCIVKERFRDQLAPIDIHDVFVSALRASDDFDAVPELVHSEPAEALLPKRETVVLWGSLLRLTLLLSVIVPWNKPHIPQDVQRHPFAVVSDGDGRGGLFTQIQAHHDPIRIGVVGVLDKFEHSKARAADQLVAEET